MNSNVQSLLDFHGTRNFGSRDNLIARQREARAIYASLSPDEESELAQTMIAKSDDEDDRAWEVLCCLACFQPGSLRRFHQRLVDSRILYPGVIFHGADAGISGDLMTLLDNDDHRNHALVALAWIGDEAVQSAFATWREQPPSWVSRLYVPPERYAHEAGWELTQEGTRRDLFHQTTVPLVLPGTGNATTKSVRTGIEGDETCQWCGRRLTHLLVFEDIGTLIPGHGTREVAILTCDVCTCYGTVFGARNNGKAEWHPKNERPDYLPDDTSDWAAFPKEPLILSGQTRHFLEAADWSMLPGVSFSQVGGIPTWVQYAAYPSCPDCSNTMPFVGQISNEDFDNGEGIYYCHHCPDCDITATSYQQT